MSVDNTDLYYLAESLKSGKELFDKIQEETNAWIILLIATEGHLQPETCFWYLLNDGCVGGVWEPADTVGYVLLISGDYGASTPIVGSDVNESRKAFSVHDCPAGEN